MTDGALSLAAPISAWLKGMNEIAIKCHHCGDPVSPREEVTCEACLPEIAAQAESGPMPPEFRPVLWHYGMREYAPQMCWAYIHSIDTGEAVCIQERGHDGNAHEPLGPDDPWDVLNLSGRSKEEIEALHNLIHVGSIPTAIESCAGDIGDGVRDFLSTRES